MAVTARFLAYLALERGMIGLDAASDPLADKLREQMDEVWYALSPVERGWLDQRAGEPEVFAGTVPAGVLDEEPAGEFVLFPSILWTVDAAA